MKKKIELLWKDICKLPLLIIYEKTLFQSNSVSLDLAIIILGISYRSQKIIACNFLFLYIFSFSFIQKLFATFIFHSEMKHVIWSRF